MSLASPLVVTGSPMTAFVLRPGFRTLHIANDTGSAPVYASTPANPQPNLTTSNGTLVPAGGPKVVVNEIPGMASLLPFTVQLVSAGSTVTGVSVRSIPF